VPASQIGHFAVLIEYEAVPTGQGKQDDSPAVEYVDCTVKRISKNLKGNPATKIE
jgi:hypothetical protein